MAEFSKRPRAVMCHICGRQYGTASIGIHLKTCSSNFLAEEAKKPAHMRRSLPAVPTETPTIGGGTGRGFDLEAYNDAAFSSYKSGLAHCEHCGRSFNPERLAIHQKSCTASSPARKVGESLPGGGGGAMGGKTEEMVPARPATAPTAAANRQRSPLPHTPSTPQYGKPKASDADDAVGISEREAAAPSGGRKASYPYASYPSSAGPTPPQLSSTAYASSTSGVVPSPARPTTAKLIPGSGREYNVPEVVGDLPPTIQHTHATNGRKRRSSTTALATQVARLQQQLAAFRLDVVKQMDALEAGLAAVADQLAESE